MTASRTPIPLLAQPSRRRTLGLAAAALLLLGPARLGWAQGNQDRGRAADEPRRGNNDLPDEPRRGNDRRDRPQPPDRRDQDRYGTSNGNSRGGDMRASQRGGDEERGAGPDHNFRRGQRLPQAYRHRNYVVDDWRGHQLSAPPRGYQWVQTGSDYVLVAIATGVILQLLLRD
jgi:Ni/Co efflux regulator RcnB